MHSVASIFERHRPRTWADVVGQERAVSQLLALRERGGFGGRAYWITGKSGTGKTTLARLIASDLAEPDCIEELDAGDLTTASLRELERFIHVYGWGKGGRAVIVNESHGLRRDVARRLLTLLEPVPAHVAVVFTTTIDGQDALFEGVEDAGPLLSRCLRIQLAQRDLAKPFAERARMIAQAEGLDGLPLERYVRLANDHKANLRAMLTAIEGGAMVKGGAL